MTPQELTWIATVFDCEGNINIARKPYIKKNGDITIHESPVVQIGHSSLDLITRFHELVGGKVYGHNYNYSYLYKTERKQIYWWKITHRAGVLWFVELIWGEWLSDYRRETIYNLGVAPDMAKHPHRLVLQNKKTWKCALDGCNFFVHLGLAHVLVGKRAVCWECGDQLTIDEAALNYEEVKCASCRYGVVDVDELMRTMQAQNKDKPKTVEKDQIEVIEPEDAHSPECAVFSGMSCTCR